MTPGANFAALGGAPGNEKSAVIMLGAHEFPDIRSVAPIPQLASASIQFRNYLLSHQIVLGIEDSFLLDLFDSNEQAGAQTELIAAFLEKLVLATPKCRTRNVFIHYAGHGLLLGDRHRLCLAVKRSRERMGSTLNISNLAEIFSDSARYTRKFIILDCCFSAAAAAEMLSDEEGLTHFVGAKATELFRDADGAQSPSMLSRGSALLCAVGKDDVASGESYNGATLFTGALLAAISNHNPAQPRITMQELRERASLCIEEYGSPKLPHMFSLDQTEGDIASKLNVFPTGGVAAPQPSPGQEQVHRPTRDAPVLSTMQNFIALCAYALILGASLYWTHPYNREIQHTTGEVSETARDPAVQQSSIQQALIERQSAHNALPPTQLPSAGTESVRSPSPQQATTSPPLVPQPPTDKSRARPQSQPDSEEGPINTPKPTPQKKQPDEWKFVEDYRAAIGAAQGAAQKRDLQVQARNSIAGAMNFGELKHVAKYGENIYTSIVSYKGYSPETNVLKVGFYSKRQEKGGRGFDSSLWVTVGEFEAVIDIYLSRLTYMDRVFNKLEVGCYPPNACMTTTVISGECPLAGIKKSDQCYLFRFDFKSQLEEDPKTKRLGEGINMVVAKIDGRTNFKYVVDSRLPQ